MRVKINSTGEIKEVKQVGDKLFDKENNRYLLGQVTVLEEWYPASELPKEDGEYIAISVDSGWECVVYVEYRKPYGWCYEIKGHYTEVNIKCWCYPPTNL